MRSPCNTAPRELLALQLRWRRLFKDRTLIIALSIAAAGAAGADTAALRALSGAAATTISLATNDLQNGDLIIAVRSPAARRGPALRYYATPALYVALNLAKPSSLQ